MKSSSIPSDNRQQHRPGCKLALFACGLAVVVVALGAFTRLVDAGLGCPDWPACYGHLLWPTDAVAIELANQAYPDMPVDVSKTWPEMVHRYFAASLGLVTIILLYWVARYRTRGQSLTLPILLVVIVVIQGLFGMWTVTLKLWPQVVTAHLLGGFTTLALLWLLVLQLEHQPWRIDSLHWPGIQRLRPWAVLGLLIVIVQIALGGWTTANYAAVACPDFPTCQGQRWPAMDFAKGFDIFQHIGPNYLGGTLDNASRIAIHISHRLGAVVTASYLLLFAWVLYRSSTMQRVHTIAVVLTATIVLQILLGVANIVFNFPVAVAVAHNIVGALLLLVVVTLNYRLFTSQKIVAP